jgi:hypothetical protein
MNRTKYPRDYVGSEQVRRGRSGPRLGPTHTIRCTFSDGQWEFMRRAAKCDNVPIQFVIRKAVALMKLAPIGNDNPSS